MREKKIDLVLMDINMPVMNGDEAVQKFRENNRETLTYICALTGNVGSDSLKDLTQNGFDDWITKPASRNDIKKVILKVLMNRVNLQI